MALPSAIVLSCGDKDPLDLIKQIRGENELPIPKAIIADSINAYPWHIETKYYEADIHLCTLVEKTLGNLDFAESVQATVIYFDSMSESSFKKVQEWMVFIEEFNPEVRLLVCDNCSDKTVGENKQNIQQWCLKQNFELVELNPDIDLDNDSEDDFAETTGIPRIIQALCAHLWPNLEMKAQSGYPTTFGKYLQKANLDDPETLDDTAAVNSMTSVESAFAKLNTSEDESAVPNGKNKSPDFGFDDSFLDNFDVSKLASVEDPDEAPAFETMFQHFQLMKEKAKSLPFEERKAYAEKVVMAFWHSMGGDEDEITGLDSD